MIIEQTHLAKTRNARHVWPGHFWDGLLTESLPLLVFHDWRFILGRANVLTQREANGGEELRKLLNTSSLDSVHRRNDHGFSSLVKMFSPFRFFVWLIDLMFICLLDYFFFVSSFCLSFLCSLISSLSPSLSRSFSGRSPFFFNLQSQTCAFTPLSPRPSADLPAFDVPSCAWRQGREVWWFGETVCDGHVCIMATRAAQTRYWRTCQTAMCRKIYDSCSHPSFSLDVYSPCSSASNLSFRIPWHNGRKQQLGRNFTPNYQISI